MDRLILTSFDDGNQLDLGLCDLLTKYRIPAVFYIPLECELTPSQMRMIVGLDSSNCPLCSVRKELFDIGAHTITHPEDLKMIPDEDAVREIAGSKAGLEKILGRPVTRFCYPSGRYNDRIKEIVKNAGFKEARGTLSESIEFPKDLFAVRPTCHVHPEKIYDNDLTWIEYAEKKLDEVIEKGGRFELWGHSFEIEKFNQWEFLEDFLFYMDEKLKSINYPRKI